MNVFVQRVVLSKNVLLGVVMPSVILLNVAPPFQISSQSDAFKGLWWTTLKS